MNSTMDRESHHRAVQRALALCRLACGERPGNGSEAAWLAGGTDCRSQLISIPIGLGKTAAVILAWLWNRLGAPLKILVLPSAISSAAADAWPLRLVYCLTSPDPFRLAWYEAVLRIAGQRASKRAETNHSE